MQTDRDTGQQHLKTHFVRFMKPFGSILKPYLVIINPYVGQTDLQNWKPAITTMFFEVWLFIQSIGVRNKLSGLSHAAFCGWFNNTCYVIYKLCLLKCLNSMYLESHCKTFLFSATTETSALSITFSKISPKRWSFLAHISKVWLGKLFYQEPCYIEWHSTPSTHPKQ